MWHYGASGGTSPYALDIVDALDVDHDIDILTGNHFCFTVEHVETWRAICQLRANSSTGNTSMSARFTSREACLEQLQQTSDEPDVK